MLSKELLRSTVLSSHCPSLAPMSPKKDAAASNDLHAVLWVSPGLKILPEVGSSHRRSSGSKLGSSWHPQREQQATDYFPGAPCYSQVLEETAWCPEFLVAPFEAIAQTLKHLGPSPQGGRLSRVSMKPIRSALWLSHFPQPHQTLAAFLDMRQQFPGDLYTDVPVPDMTAPSSHHYVTSRLAGDGGDPT